VFFPFMKEVDDHLARRDLNAELVADRDSVFGPVLDEIHREFSVGGRGRSDWVGRDPIARILRRTEADFPEEPLLQLADVAAGTHCSVVRDRAAGHRLNRQQQETRATWTAARNRGRHFVWASPAVHAMIAGGHHG
jgi:hypothetical protein